MKAIDIDAFSQLVADGLPVIDIRNAEQIMQGFIKGSIALPSPALFGLRIGSFSSYSLHSGFTPVLLVGNEQQDYEAFLQKLPEGGNERIEGYLQGGFEAWQQAGGNIDLIIDVEADELMMDIPFDENLVVIDVRPAISYGGGHLKDAISLPLDQILDPLRLAAIEDTDNLYLLGEHTDDAIFAASILKKQEIHNLRVVQGGWAAIQKEEKAEIVKDPGMLN